MIPNRQHSRRSSRQSIHGAPPQRRHSRRSSRGIDDVVIVERMMGESGARRSASVVRSRSRSRGPNVAVEKQPERVEEGKVAGRGREGRRLTIIDAPEMLRLPGTGGEGAGSGTRRERSRSVTYENPRASGRVGERQRVVFQEEDGRRRESYIVPGTGTR